MRPTAYDLRNRDFPTERDGWTAVAAMRYETPNSGEMKSFCVALHNESGYSLVIPVSTYALETAVTTALYNAQAEYRRSTRL